MAIADRLMNARCRLMTRDPWYGHCAMSMVWIPSEMSWLPECSRTMGVRIVNGGDIQCIYYPTFVDSQSIEELIGVVQHEIEHVVRVHCVRIGQRDPFLWNMACDMAVNGPRNFPRIGYRDTVKHMLILPMGGDIVWIPADWSTDETAEYYYNKLEKMRDKARGKARGTANSESDDDPFGGMQFGGIIDDHTVWNQTDVSEDEARQVIRDMITTATDKCQGRAPGHLTEAIARLNTPVVRWRELLRHYLGKHVGNQRKTYSRRNRRRDWFGVAGISHHAAANVCVIIDTSGSIGTKELEQFFAEIDAIASKAQVSILQWDFEFHGFDKYRRGDWKKFQVHGRGGTDMAAPVRWLIENRLVADVQVMLTDGFTGWAEKKEVAFPFITVITTPDTIGPTYGSVVRMTLA